MPRYSYMGESQYRKLSAHEKNANIPPNKTLSVFGLSTETTESRLFKRFEEYGYITDARIVRDHYTNVSRGFAFLHFRNVEDAETAKYEANGCYFMGKKMRIEYSLDRSKYTSQQIREMTSSKKNNVRSRSRTRSRSPWRKIKRSTSRTSRSRSPYDRSNCSSPRGRSRNRSYSPKKRQRNSNGRSPSPYTRRPYSRMRGGRKAPITRRRSSWSRERSRERVRKEACK